MNSETIHNNNNTSNNVDFLFLLDNKPDSIPFISPSFMINVWNNFMLFTQHFLFSLLCYLVFKNTSIHQASYERDTRISNMEHIGSKVSTPSLSYGAYKPNLCL
ncbi:MAG: hypothetical protein AB7U98_07845 [Candidatus Nitrosocosmicus sp.]